MDISIVIPVKDEAENIPALLNEIEDVLPKISAENSAEVLMIDDGSSDDTWKVLLAEKEKKPFLKGYRFQYNRGKADALALGFKEAQGDIVITMDGDLQDDPAELPALVAKINEGYDLVSGWKKKRHDPWHKTMPSKLFNLVTSIVAGSRLHDFNCGLKAYRKNVVKNVDLYGDFHRYIPVLARWMGFKITELPVNHRARTAGVSKYGASRLVSGFLDLLTLIFLQRYARKPLHFFGTVGLLFSLVGTGILGYFAVYWMVHGELHVRPLLVLGGTAVILGIQFISLGFLGEMLNKKSAREAFPLAEEF